MIKGLYKPFEHWGKNTCWIISDTHFGDPDLIYPYPDRPTAAEQVKLINSKVGKNDTLIILGDVGNIEWVQQLRGYKVLVMGNHDAGASNYQRHIFKQKFDKGLFQKHEALDEIKRLYSDCAYSIIDSYNFLDNSPCWEASADNKLFDEVFSGPIMVSEKLILSHEPVEELDWCMNIHGHTHDRNIVNDKYHFNVCADVIGYIPINFNKWMKDGHLAKIQSLHRQTINEATDRRRRKGG